MNEVDYKKIYKDIIMDKCPQKYLLLEEILNKDKLIAIDILRLNKIIFEQNDTKNDEFNQKLKSYTIQDVNYILNYQKRNKMTNNQLAKHFKMSRNTISKWKKSLVNNNSF